MVRGPRACSQICCLSQAAMRRRNSRGARELKPISVATNQRRFGQEEMAGKPKPIASIHLLCSLAAVAALGCSAIPPSAPPAAHQSFSDTLTQYGFVELRPPSTLLPPGTIVRLRSREPLQAQIVCTQKGALGATVEVQSSDSNSTSLGSRAEKSFQLEASAMPFLATKSAYQSIGSVVVQLSNVRVLEIADSTVYEGAAQRSESCRRAIDSLNADPATQVSMIKSVLAADVSYGVEFKTSETLDAGSRLALVKALAVDLGADADSATAEQVKGSSLFWGVTDEIRLAQLGEHAEAVAEPAGGSAAGPSGDGDAPAEGAPQFTMVPNEPTALPGDRALLPAHGALALDPKPLAE